MVKAKAEVVSGAGVFEFDVKRFYVPGLVLRSTCPHCDEVIEQGYDDQYISYPTANKSIGVHFYHECEDGEDHEWSCDVVLRLTVEPVP